MGGQRAGQSAAGRARRAARVRRVCEAGRNQPAVARRAEQRLCGSLRRSRVLQPGLHHRACCKQCWGWQRYHCCNWRRPGGAARVRIRCMAAIACASRAGLEGASSRISQILHPTTNLFSSTANGAYWRQGGVVGASSKFQGQRRLVGRRHGEVRRQQVGGGAGRAWGHGQHGGGGATPVQPSRGAGAPPSPRQNVTREAQTEGGVSSPILSLLFPTLHTMYTVRRGC